MEAKRVFGRDLSYYAPRFLEERGAHGQRLPDHDIGLIYSKEIKTLVSLMFTPQGYARFTVVDHQWPGTSQYKPFSKAQPAQRAQTVADYGIQALDDRRYYPRPEIKYPDYLAHAGAIIPPMMWPPPPTVATPPQVVMALIPPEVRTRAGGLRRNRDGTFSVQPINVASVPPAETVPVPAPVDDTTAAEGEEENNQTTSTAVNEPVAGAGAVNEPDPTIEIVEDDEDEPPPVDDTVSHDDSVPAPPADILPPAEDTAAIDTTIDQLELGPVQPWMGQILFIIN